MARWLAIAFLVLAWRSWAAEPPAGATPVSPVAVTVTAGRVSADWRDQPLRECLTALCRQLDCALYFDPAISNRVTLSLRGQPIEKALPRLLRSVNYMAVWNSMPDPEKGRIDRIAELRVYRAGQEQRASLVVAPRGADSTAPRVVLTADEIRRLEKLVTDRARPDEAGAAARQLAADGSPAAVLALWKGVAAWNPETDDDDEAGLSDPVSRAAMTVTNRAAFAVLLDRYLQAGASENEQLLARFLLGRMADGGIVDAIRNAYEGTPGSDGRERLEALVAAVTGRSAERALVGLAGSSDSAPSGPLSRAALLGLSNMGTATAADDLLNRLEKAASSTGARAEAVRTAVGQMAGTPEAIAALRYAAAGNKRFSNGATRATAVEALARYPDSRTLALLRQLTQDPDARVAQAAIEALGAILADREEPGP